MTVVLGAHNISKKEKSQQWIQVAEYIPHPEYTGESDNDIMLLKVNKSMQKFILKKIVNQFLCKSVCTFYLVPILSVSFSRIVLLHMVTSALKLVRMWGEALSLKPQCCFLRGHKHTLRCLTDG